MKYLILPLLLFAIPSPAIAETFNGQPLPANYMIFIVVRSISQQKSDRFGHDRF